MGDGFGAGKGGFEGRNMFFSVAAPTYQTLLNVRIANNRCKEGTPIQRRRINAQNHKEPVLLAESLIMRAETSRSKLKTKPDIRHR